MFYLEQFDLIQFRPIGAVGEIINMKQVHSQGSTDPVVPVRTVRTSIDPGSQKNEVTLTSQVNSKSGSPTGPSVRKSQKLDENCV